MGISTKEISEVIKERLKDFDASLVSADVGRIVAVGDGIAQIYGLQNAMAGELLEFPHETYGLALNLEEDQVRAVILGEFGHLHEGDEVRTTGRLLEVPVGDELLGRIVNPLGVPIDDKGPIKTSKTLPVEKIAPGVITRKRVDSPVQTGIKAIDTMIPIGRVSVVSIGPWPSSGWPSGLTIRPINASPTGMLVTRPVRLTTSTSLTCSPSPKSAVPTLSSSRLSARPVTPCSNSSISSETAFSSP